MLKQLLRTLRFRLAAWNAVVVILAALVTLIGLRQGVRWAILHEMDRILIEDFEEIRMALQQSSRKEFDAITEDLDRKAIGHKHHGWFVQLLSADGRDVWSSIDTPDDLKIVSAVPSSRPASLDDYRVLERHVRNASRDVASVRLGASLDFLREDMARIDRLVMLVAGFVLLAAPIVGYWLASRAARIVSNITHSAERLRPSHLEERLPIRGTGDELDQLAQTINGLLERMRDHLEQKRDFLANAAHELRTPLAAIRSSVEVALSSDRTKAEYQELLIEIIDQGTALQTLVNQLLLISESEAERLKEDVDPVSLDETVRRSVDMFAGIAESRGVTLDVQIPKPVTIRGSRHLLHQLVNNLIDNAVKYTPSGGRVTVELTLNQKHRTVELKVADTGVGIAADDLPKVFDRFFRADKSRSRISQTAGTGLGLSICQAAATAHNGGVRCESAPNKGSCFTVELPLEALKSQLGAAQSDHAPHDEEAADASVAR